ncbi:DDE-type integrase/transposase/recombinase [Sphingobacterium spiritivorum]|uniref:DDE-type integrase/transposase/recombinase n=1 Tax=Sphingobacterium spiritivorum TaxID=258 RepID=UPI003DA5A932
MWNRKIVLRVYQNINLKLRTKRKRRIPSRIKEKLIVPGSVNDTWPIDFMSDSLANGRRFRVLNVIDDYNCESLINEAFYSIPGNRLVQKLKELIMYRSKPKRIRTDNGPEFFPRSSPTFVLKTESYCNIYSLENPLKMLTSNG